MNKKAVSSVVATAVLLVVVVIAVTGFQSWFNDYASNMFSDAEVKSNNAAMTQISIDSLISNYLYVINNEDYNVSVTELKMENITCAQVDNLTPGIMQINVSDCLGNLTTSKPYAVLITNICSFCI